MNEKILILDFGSQYTQLIARRVRELNVYSEIVPYSHKIDIDSSVKGVILSGSPCSVMDEKPLSPEFDAIVNKVPVLGVCYGAQWIAKYYGGTVEKSKVREYGKANLSTINHNDILFNHVSDDSQVWMSHADTIFDISDKFEIIASTEQVKVAAFKSVNDTFTYPVYGIQFHPEVTHSLEGKALLSNFVLDICGCTGDWSPAAFIREQIELIKTKVGDAKAIMALSGGVDSTVCAMLMHRAIGDHLTCIFVDNGLLRKNEYDQVLDSYKGMGLHVIGVDAKDHFYGELAGLSDPEQKRKTIGRVFIEVFEKESKKIEGAGFLGQGTIYPDVIESVSVHGPSVTIKSHHNVGGLPDKLNLKIIEPLRLLFKDEVRRVGAELGIPSSILGRHPFPGPGLAIRILGDITAEKVSILQEADAIYINELRQAGLYDQIWQAGAILLPVQSVGVMGDERSYEKTIALRAVNSVDGMTAEWSRIPYEVLANISSKIINQVKGINRVVYDISTKPPATIEWE